MCSRPVLSTLSTPCVTLSFLESELTLRGNHLKSTALAWIGKWLSVSFKRSLTAFAKPLGPLIVPQERRIDLFSLCGAGVHLFTRWFHVSAFTLLIQNLIFWKVFLHFCQSLCTSFQLETNPSRLFIPSQTEQKKNQSDKVPHWGRTRQVQHWRSLGAAAVTQPRSSDPDSSQTSSSQGQGEKWICVERGGSVNNYVYGASGWRVFRRGREAPQLLHTIRLRLLTRARTAILKNERQGETTSDCNLIDAFTSTN